MKIMTEEEAKVYESNAQIKFIIQKFQDGMSRIEAFENKIKEIIQLSSHISQKNENLTNSNQDLLKKVEDNKNNSIVTTNTLFIKLQDNVSKISEAFLHIDGLNKSINAVKADIQSVRAQLDQMFESMKDFSSTKVYNNLEKKFISLEHEFKENLTLNAKTNAETKQGIESFFKSMSDTYTDIYSCQMVDKDHKKAIDDLGSKLEQMRLKTETSIDNVASLLTRSIDDKIASLPKPPVTSLEEAKKALDIKVEPALLDSKNANLRSTNNEHKILILEKKVEQLQLLINKFQLQG